MFWTSLCILFCLDEFRAEPLSAETQKWVRYLEEDRFQQTRGALFNSLEYVARFRVIFREQGVPEDLVWLALIESSFLPHVTSPTGARGMYQFKPLTARAFGLKVSGNLDERYDPLLSAHAAARYLAYLSKKFASWELVLAAYNLGEGDLRRAMLARGATSWQQVRPFVRKETRDFVGKVKAAVVVGNRFWDSDRARELKSSKVYRVRKGDSLYAIARDFGVAVEALLHANDMSSHHLSVDQILIIPQAQDP